MNTFPTSTLTLAPLQPEDTPSLCDIRPFLARMARGPESDSFEAIQQAIDALQEIIRTASPFLKYLSIDAADIAVLNVGSQFAPGEFTVYNGPPDYLGIGWIGSRANATSVTITSIVAGLVTAAASHGLKVGDNVYIEATTDINNTGFYVVATTPLTTTYTVVGGVAGGNSTGGTSTLQFQGGWLKTFAVGGTYFGDAPFQVDVDGTLSITDALITLNGTGATIVLDPTDGSITVTQAGGGYRTTIRDGFITLDDTTALDDQTIETPGIYQAFKQGLAAVASSRLLDIYGFTGATEFGPLLSITQARGTAAASTATQSGDTIGGIVGWGYDGIGESQYPVGIRMLATENHNATDHGAGLVFETTPNGSTVPVTVLALDADVSLPLLTTNGGLVHTNGSGKLTSAKLLPNEMPGYAFVNLTGQAAAIGATNIQPDGAIAIAGKQYFLDGFFRITTVGTAGNINLAISWNDGTGLLTQNYSLLCTSLASYLVILIPVVADGATNIQYAVTFVGVTGTPQYRLQLAIRKEFN